MDIFSDGQVFKGPIRDLSKGPTVSIVPLKTINNGFNSEGYKGIVNSYR